MQRDDGQVLLACHGDDDAFEVFVSDSRRFRGTNSDGISFTADRGHFVDLPLLRAPPETGSWAVYEVPMLHAALPTSGPPALVRYLLTNLEFGAREKPQHTPLHLPGVEGEVRLFPESSDLFATARLRAFKQARATARLEIRPQDGHAARTRRIANDLCDLLSIARGTKVAWIQEEVINTTGARTHLIHSSRITKPFTSLAPIDPQRVGNVAGFLEQTYPVFRDRREKYRLDRGTIDAVLDAKVETDFLETRGAKLAVALESLKQNVLVHSHPVVDHYIPPEDFARIVPDFVKRSRAILTSQGVASDTANSMIDKRRVLSLNRLGFGKLLGLVAGEVGLQLPGEDIKLFVQCRNSLVHRGDFYCNTASLEEREEVPPKASHIEEYFFMLSVVDAFLLRLVGYTGKYLVRTTGPRGGELRSL
jgi:hypothetical protein